MPLKILEVHFDCTGSQNLRGGGGCLSGLRSRCGVARMFGHDGHFLWQAQGKPRALVVAGAALRTWWRSSTRSNFVTGAVNRDFGHVARLHVASAVLCGP